MRRDWAILAPICSPSGESFSFCFVETMSDSQIDLKGALSPSIQNSTPTDVPEVQARPLSEGFKDDLLGVRYDPDLEAIGPHEELVQDQFQRELAHFQGKYMAVFDGTLAYLRRILPTFCKEHVGESAFKLGLYLSAMDIPDFWITQLKTSINNAQKFGDGVAPVFPSWTIKVTEPKKTFHPSNPFKHGHSTGITNTSKSMGKHTSNSFRLNVKPGRFGFPKPDASNFSKRRYMLWLESEVTRLTPFLKRKTQFLSANMSVQALMRVKTFPGTKKSLQAMLDASHVYIDEYVTGSQASRSVMTLFPGTINVAGTIVTSLIGASKVAYLFKKHKPIFRALCRMYEDADYSAAQKIQSDIDSKVLATVKASVRRVEEATAVVPKLRSVSGKVVYQGNVVAKARWPPQLFDILRVYLWKFLPYRNYSMFPLAAIRFHQSNAAGTTLISEATLPLLCLAVQEFRLKPQLYRPMLPLVPKHLLVRNLQLTCEQCRVMLASNLGLDRCYFHSMQVSNYKDRLFAFDRKFERIFQYVEYQGQTFSMRHSVDFERTTSATRSVVGKVAADLYHEYEQPLAQFAAFVGSLYCASSWGAVVAAVAQYAAGNDVIWSIMKDQIRKLQSIVFQQAGEPFMFTPFTEAIGAAAMSLWEAITSLGLYSLFSTVLSDISSSLFGPLADLVKQVRFQMLKEAGKSIAESILAGIKECINRVKLCWESKSFAPLWGVRWNPTTWVKQSTTIRVCQGILTASGRTCIGADSKLKRLRESGDLPMWWTDPVSLPEYVKNATGMLEQGYNLIEYFQKNKPMVDFLQAEMRLLRSTIEEARPRAQGVSLRMEPFSLVLFGESSVGKTNMIALIQNAVAHYFGFSPEATYDLDLTQGFQSGLKFDTWLVRMDDVDQGTAPQAANVRNHIEWFMKLVNNNPLPIEESESAIKGSTFAAPAMVAVATNFADCRVSEFSLFPTAYWRRVNLYLKPKVRPEYATPNGQIDKHKFALASTYDLWLIDVYEYDSSALPSKVRGHIPMRLVKENETFPNVVAMIIERMRDKREREIKRLGKLMDAGGSDRCPVCFLPTEIDCGHEPVQAVLDELEVVQGYADVIVPVCGVASLFAARAAFHTVPPWMRWGLYTMASVRTGRHICDVIVDNYFGDDYFTKTAHVVGVCAALAFMVNGAFRQGRSGNALTGFNPFNWFRAEQTHKPGIPQPHFQATWTEEELMRLVMDSFITVSGPYFKDMHALMINHNTFLVPSHVSSVARNAGPTHCMLTILARGESHTLQLTEFNSVVIPTAPELMLVKDYRSFGAPGLLKHFWQVVDEQVVQFDSVRIVSPKLDVDVSANELKVQQGFKVLETSYPSREGDCGSVYLARMGTSVRIVAMHYAGNQVLSFPSIVTTTSLGACVTGLEIERLLTTRLTTVRQGVATSLLMMSRTPERLSVKHYPMLSEVHTARSHHGAKFYPFGTLEPPLVGATMKSKIQPSLYAEDFRDLEEKWCGERHYWRIPDFRGKMVDDKWKSPYTDAFLTANWKQIEEPYMWLALADYLSGITSLDCTGFSALSQHEALVGVPGSVIHGINLSTSSGPPYSTKKVNHYLKAADESFVSPEMHRIRTDILRLFPESIVSAVALCSLKDETLKPGKIPRIFSVLSSEFNTFIKEEMAVVSAFMRANVDFFECCVGINMTGPDATRLVNSLKVVDPSLTRIMAGDAKRLDKSYSGDLHEFVCYLFFAVAKALGLNAAEAYVKALGIKYTKYIIKNDVFVSFWLPSGFIDTVEWNSFSLSLGDRFVYYKDKYPVIPEAYLQALVAYARSFFDDPFATLPIPLDFRQCIVLRTYGDDNIKAYSVTVNPPANYEDLWLEGIGIEMTDASKEGRIKLVPLSKADFLKRTFVFDEQSGMWMAQLSKKTLARMLVFKKDSSLSVRDHAALALTEVLLESFLHGEQFFNETRARFIDIASKYSLAGSFLKLPTYETCREQFSRGVFKTWVERGIPELRELQSDLVQLHGFSTMSSIQMVKAGIDPAGNDEVTSTTTNIQHDTGQIVSDSTLVQNKLEVTPKYFQNMPTNDLGDFMTRATEIATWPLAATDSPLTSVATLDPWSLFLANPRIADKISSYTYIRGTIQLIFVTAVPGNCYGSYVVSALPRGGLNTDTFNVIGATLQSTNCMQMDHFSRLDCANSENMVMQLPFLWQYDFADLTVGAPASMWRVTLTCLSPLQTAIQGGVSTGQIQVYASLLPDYQLTVPHFQGHHRKGKLQHTPSMATMAPTLAAALPQPHGQVSAVADKVGAIADKLSGVPVIGSYAHAASQAAHTVSKVASWFGFTREEEEREPMPITMRSVTNVAHIDGVDVSDKASLLIGNTLSIDPTMMGLSSGSDCLSTADLFNRWTVVQQLTWSPTASAGTVLGTTYVSPNYGIGTSSTTGATINLTTAGYFGVPFTYWRGDMEYLIIVPVSKLHRGTLQIYWIPFGSTPPATVTNTSLNLIYDVSAGGEKQFTVGYARDKPFLLNWLLPSSTTIVPQGTTNGQLAFRVVNPLQSQNSTASVTITILARAASNMEFAVPRNVINVTTTSGQSMIPLDSAISYQGATGDEDDHSADVVELVPSSGAYPSDELLFGEKIESVRPLLQKFSKIYSGVPTANLNVISIFGENRNLDYDTYRWTFAMHYRNLYQGLAASERFKFITASDMWIGATNSSGESPVPTQYVNDITPMTFCGQNRGAEVVVPYYGPAKWYWAGSVPDAATSSFKNNLLWMFDASGTVPTTPVTIYHAFGADIRVTCFHQVPKISLDANTLVELFPTWFGHVNPP
jgi:hypothetical protein